MSPEVGDPVDPCEREVDRLRRVLAQPRLALRARELARVGPQHLHALAGTPPPAIPQSLERTALVRR